MSQLSFSWPASVSLETEDYFVSAANRSAHDMVTRPDTWPRGKLVIAGPKASGKSHLARVFAAQTGAQVLNAPDQTAHSPLHPIMPTIVEDADALPPEAEEWLFHLHNALSGRAPLLLTAQREPAHWPTALADLASRMQAATVVRIDTPDDAMLTAVLMKLFADRQIAPEPELPAYLAQRLERSFAAINAAVEQLDRLALAHKRPVTRRLASDWLAGKI